MVKETLLKKISAKLTSTSDKQISIGDISLILNTYAEVIKEEITTDGNEDKIPLPGIGAFVKKHIAERKGTSALSGKDWVVPAHDELGFKVSETVRKLN